jgi:hypothetical protein
MDNRAVRLPQTTCRNIFAHHSAQQSSRRGQTAPSIRPDKEAEAPSIFQQPAEDELVERNEKGEYVIQAPTPVYRNMALSGLEREAEEETGTSGLSGLGWDAGSGSMRWEDGGRREGQGIGLTGSRT